jgi:nucleolar protein 58
MTTPLFVSFPFVKLKDSQKYSKLSAQDIEGTLFPDVESARSNLELVSFQAFSDTADAVSAITSCQEGKVGDGLSKFLSKKLKKILKNESSTSGFLAVADKALASSLKDQDVIKKLKIVVDDKSAEVFRGIRSYMDQMLGDVSADDLKKMQLGLSHSLGRYKLKFSADKVDTMVIQAVGLLDELDKEINTYAMRVKEWYGWHFPELQALCPDNAKYAKLVLATGHRYNYKEADLTGIFDETAADSESEIRAIREAAEISMGTDITDVDVINIQSLARQVLSMTEYRAQLFEYLKNRMNAIAPNLTILTGEMVGARLIAHAGSLLNLAKQPASTVQILGAEKALFRALKTKHDTPKYGLIYHASLIGQAAPKHKGKISRVLAAKASLAIRVDALTDDTAGGEPDTTVGYEGRAKVERRLRELETGSGGNTLKSTVSAQKTAKYDPVAAKTAATNTTYNTASDIKMDAEDEVKSPGDKKKAKKEKKEKKEKKRKSTENGDEGDNGDEEKRSAKKAKKEKKENKK